MSFIVPLYSRVSLGLEKMDFIVPLYPLEEPDFPNLGISLSRHDKDRLVFLVGIQLMVVGQNGFNVLWNPFFYRRIYKLFDQVFSIYIDSLVIRGVINDHDEFIYKVELLRWLYLYCTWRFSEGFLRTRSRLVIPHCRGVNIVNISHIHAAAA